MSLNKFLTGFIITLVVVLIGGSVALSRAPGNTITTSQGVTQENAATPEPRENSLAGIKLAKLGGGEIDIGEYQGDKAVVVDFWASWCHNCRRDMPVMNSLYEKYKDDVEVVAINLQEGEATVKRFIDSQGFSFPVVLDPGARASRAIGVRYTNTHVLISKEGQLVKIIPGDIDEADFLSLIN